MDPKSYPIVSDKQDDAIKNPLVSVVVPLFNGGNYIKDTLMSILSQSYDNFEILVVDDSSSDDGPIKVSEFMEQYPDKIRMLSHPDHKNLGVAPSRNVAIRNAKGYYIAFLDQDDIWLPDKLEKQIVALQQYPEASLVYAKVIYIDEGGKEKKIRGIHPTYGKGVVGNPRNVFSKLIQEDFIPNLTVLVKKSCLERVGLLDEGPRYEYEDWLLLSKLAYFYKFLFIPEVLGKWREHSSNYSSNIFNTGQFRDAEEHCTIALFSFLVNESGVAFNKIRKHLRCRVWRLFLRARSWGASKKELAKHVLNFINAFPKELRSIQFAFHVAVLIHPQIASSLRRLRRKIVGT